MIFLQNNVSFHNIVVLSYSNVIIKIAQFNFLPFNRERKKGTQFKMAREFSQFYSIGINT